MLHHTRHNLGESEIMTFYDVIFAAQLQSDRIAFNCDMYKLLSDDKHQMVQDSSKNALVSTDIIVTRLLCYHMPLLYCTQPFNCLFDKILYFIKKKIYILI